MTTEREVAPTATRKASAHRNIATAASAVPTQSPDPFVGHVARCVAADTGAKEVQVVGWRKLSGGAIQQNIAVDAEIVGGALPGRHRWVVRTDAPSAVAVSRTRAEEFALLEVAHATGVKVPRPLWSHGAGASFPAFFVMERVDGVAAGHRLTRDIANDSTALVRDLAVDLARIHSIAPPRAELAFLGAPSASPTRDFLRACRDYLDHWQTAFGAAHPTLEWGLRHCDAWLREDAGICLLHHDFRTGNYLVHEGRLAAILDWEFAGWGHRLEDIGWFFARCWRFARPDRVAGGIASADDFLNAYNAATGTSFAERDTRYWQLLAHLRWAVIALQQTERHLSGRESSLELALTGRLLPELEWEILKLVERIGRE
jgi:aminoglycoside phosphotransferase (APT) family kinase protein